MQSRHLLLPLLLAACFSDGRGETTGTTTTAATAATQSMTSVATTDDATDTAADTWSSSTTGTTGAWPTTSATTGTTWPDTTGDISATAATTSTTGDDNPGCTMYCAAMMKSCTGEHGQYGSIESCLGVCASLPPGTPGETAGNSLSCRAYHAGMAELDPATHCVHAGPGGAGTCGNNCDGFCSIAIATCPAEHPTLDACMATCGGFMDTESYDIGDAAGDTLACRLYHLGVAATDDASALVHCPHTVAASPPCM